MDDQLYYETADIVNRTLSKERNVRTLVYNSHYSNKKKLLRLCCETLKYRQYLEKLIKMPGVSDLLRHRTIQNNRTLLSILLYEFVIGSAFRLVPRHFAIAITTNQKAIQSAVDELDRLGEGYVNEQEKEAPVQIPRYARVNAIRWSMEEAEEALAKEQWVLQKMEDGESPEGFRKAVAAMTEELVYYDPHIEYLLVFHPNTQIHNYWMVTEGYLILQDKASCLPAFLANPEPYTHVFDVCSAPGMKTSHLAAILSNQGKVWAIDKANDRYELMKTMLDRAGVTIASPFCGDFLKVDVTDKKFRKVKTAVVDPPCSGSGIVKRMDNLLGAEPKNQRRLNGLHNLQVMILKHTMRLPNLDRLVYSTCSVHEEEDESVIEEVVSDPDCPFELVEVLPSWRNRGLSKYEFGQMCLRADPKTDLTNGFFVAVFARKASFFRFRAVDRLRKRGDLQAEMTSRATQAVGFGMEEEDWYHGLLPREDLPHLLKKPGDYLVRTSEPTPGSERQVIISIMTMDKTATVRHVIVLRTPDGRYTIDPHASLTFPSVAELLTHYEQNRMSLLKSAPVMLVSPIRRQPWELRHDDLELTTRLGEGAFGEVYRGVLRLQNNRSVDVAVKLTKTTEMTKDKIKEMMKEARLIRSYDHPNVVRLYGVVVEHEPLMIVMEFINGGALNDYLRKSNASPPEKLKKMTMQAAWGLEYLHSKQCIHCDIAARNCLYANGNTVKISDFGLSREGSAYRMTQSRPVPIKWLAPETITSLTYTAKSDVWSYGIMVWEIYSNGLEPYPGMSSGEVREKVTCGYHMDMPLETPDSVTGLIVHRCWAMNPDQRFTMEQVARTLETIVGCSPQQPQQSLRSAMSSSRKPSSRLNSQRRASTGPGHHLSSKKKKKHKAKKTKENNTKE